MSVAELLLLFPLLFILFWLPALLGGLLLARWCRLPPLLVPLLALLLNSLIGYAVFWAYFASPMVGRIASIVVLGLSALALPGWLPWRAQVLPLLRTPDLRWPLALMFAVGFFYLSVLYAIEVQRDAEEQAIGRFPNLYLAIDNVLPLYFADRLAHGEEAHILIADWHSSDRPPLQSGVILVYRPLVSWTASSVGVHYQLLGTILQLSWVAVVWVLCRLVHVEAGRLAWVFAFLLCSGFFLFHSVFVWPKMLAGTFTVSCAILLLPWPELERSSRWGRLVLASLMAALAMLAHGGSFFALLALGCLLLWPRFFPGFLQTIVGCALFLALMLPWLAYQRYYDPPGNRLVKWHLAGVIPVDERSAGQAIRDSYRSLTLGEFVHNKAENLLAQIGLPFLRPEHDFTPDRPLPLYFLGHWMNGEYYNLLKALGVLNVGWLLLLRRTPSGERMGWLLLLATMTLFVWVLLMFAPGSTTIYQGSFAMMLLFFVPLAVVVADLSLKWRRILLTIALVDFLGVWVLTGPESTRPNFPLTLLPLPTAALVVALLMGLARSSVELPRVGDTP